MSSAAAVRQGIYKSGLARRVTRWLDAIPHPAVAMEISSDRVAVARWGRSGAPDAFAVELFPPGSDEISDRKSTRLNSSHVEISYAVFCLKKKRKIEKVQDTHGMHF